MKKSILFEGITVTLLILLIFMLIAMIMGESGGPSERSIPGSDQVQYIYTGSDNTLYMFYTNHIQAIDAKGNELWDFHIPDQWKIAYSWRYNTLLNWDKLYVIAETGTSRESPITSSDNGTLYVYLLPNETHSDGWDTAGIDARMSEGMIAISGNSKALWSLPLQSQVVIVTNVNNYGIFYNESFSDANIYAKGGRVYVFHDYNETIVDSNGTLLWNIDSIADPASVDEEGFVYCVPAAEPYPEYSQPLYKNIPSQGYSQYNSVDDQINYLVPSAIMDAYYPNGTQLWRKYPGEPIYRQYLVDEHLPIYNNGTIYAPLENGIIAYDREGHEKWAKKYNHGDFAFEYPGLLNKTDFTESDFSLYSPMPFDSKGDVYIQYLSRSWIPQGSSLFDQSVPELFLITIGPDGSEIARDQFRQDKYKVASDGIGYNTSIPDVYPVTVENLTDLRTKSLVAYNIQNGSELWNYSFPVGEPTFVTVDDTNAGKISGYLESNYPYQVNDQNTMNTDLHHANISTVLIREVIAGDSRVYAQFSSINYESPVIYNKSKAAYVSGVYALGENGSLLWSKTISPTARDINIVNNSTIIYRNGDGKLVVTNTGAAMGFALTTFLYIFIRFFCIGAIARAHSRINKNVNRNFVYDFIVKNPGSTMYEISRGLGMNLGTVRYHAFILGMNHRIVPYKEDGKYIRYFTNSNSYSKEDQFIVSLLRRDAVGKVLAYMVTRPAVSNAEIARELGLQESIVSRCVRELSEKGVLVKEPSGTRSAYMIVDSHRERVSSIMRRIHGE